MPFINSVQFGEITVDDKDYHQVLIVDDNVMERDNERLEKEFGTSHKIGEWEKEQLFEDDPIVIVIGTGFDGNLEVEPEFIEEVSDKKIELIIAKTPEAVKIYNENFNKGKNVNALIHTTC